MLEKHLDYLNTNHFLSSLSPLAFHEHLSSSFSPFSSSLSRAHLSPFSCSYCCINTSQSCTRITWSNTILMHIYKINHQATLPCSITMASRGNKTMQEALGSFLFFSSLLVGGNKGKWRHKMHICFLSLAFIVYFLLSISCFLIGPFPK